MVLGASAASWVHSGRPPRSPGPVAFRGGRVGCDGEGTALGEAAPSGPDHGIELRRERERLFAGHPRLHRRVHPGLRHPRGVRIGHRSSLPTHSRPWTWCQVILIVVFGRSWWQQRPVRHAHGPFRRARFVVRPRPRGVGSAGHGMAFAFAWTPCIGPVLGSVLTLAPGPAARPRAAWPCCWPNSLGLGVPFLLSGLACAE